jgi:hypothetical protein
MTLYDPQRVACHVFASNKPGRVLTTTSLGTLGLEPTDAQALTLTQCVKRQTDVLAYGAALGILDRAGFFGDVAV